MLLTVRVLILQVISDELSADRLLIEKVEQLIVDIFAMVEIFRFPS